MAMSGCGQTDPVRKQADVQESSGLVLAKQNRPGSGKTQPARIRFVSGWPCPVMAKRIRSGSKPVCKNHHACFWQNRTGSVLAKRNWPGSGKTRLAQIWFGSGWPCPVVAKWIRSGSKLVCKNHQAWFQPTASRPDPNHIWAGSSMFTGTVFCLLTFFWIIMTNKHYWNWFLCFMVDF